MQSNKFVCLSENKQQIYLFTCYSYFEFYPINYGSRKSFFYSSVIHILNFNRLFMGADSFFLDSSVMKFGAQYITIWIAD